MKDILKEMACNIVDSLEINLSWGCTGFDAVIGRSGLRVRVLFPFINKQNKLNDNKVVSLDAFRAQKLAA